MSLVLKYLAMRGINHNFSSQAHRKWGWGILIILRQTQVESKEHESQAQGRWQMSEINTDSA